MTFFNSERFNILLAIDGSEETYRALKYAERVGRGNDADITLLYVRPIDRSSDMAGLDMRAVRQNMLDWGLELPGMASLEATRAMLIASGYMSNDWKAEAAHREVTGDPLGDTFVNYTSEKGARITLKLIVRQSMTKGILDELSRYDYDLTILALNTGAGGNDRRRSIGWPVVRNVIDDYAGTVLVARGIVENHGHLICVVNNQRSVDAAVQDAIMASRCDCPVYLLSVAPDEAGRAEAETAIERANAAIAAVNVPVVESKVRVGDPKSTIIRQGRHFSVIVMSEPHVRGLRRLFTTSVSYDVLRDASNSVMIIQ